MTKNILIISYSYPPNNVAGAQRPYAIAKYLDKTKFNIIVLTCENPYTPVGINKSFDPSLENVKIINIKSKVGSSNEVVKQNNNHPTKPTIKSIIKSSLYKFGQLFIFPDKAMFWYPNVKKFLKQNPTISSEAAIVFSTSPGITNHQIAKFIQKQNPSIQWIADFRDFNYVEFWQSKKNLKSFLHKLLENRIVKKASNITFVTNTMLKAYQNYYPSAKEKMHCIYNGYDNIESVATTQSMFNEKLIFFYGGSFYNGLRSPFPLIELLERAIDEKIISKEQIEIQIAGNIEEEIISELNRYKVSESIQYLGNIPRLDVFEYIKNATFLWLIVANLKAHYQTVPIKLFEYISVKRPILNFAPDISESSELINGMNAGYNFNTFDFSMDSSYQLMKEILIKFNSGDFNNPIHSNGSEIFSWNNQISLLEKLFESNEK